MASLDFDAEKTAFRDFYDSNRDTLTGAVSSFNTLIRSLLLSQQDIALSSVDGRIKDREECVSKFTRKYRAALEESKTEYEIKEKITDVLGLRVVVLYEDDVERVRQAVLKEFDVLEITDKIAQVEGTESSFGYKGLHLDLKLNAVRAAMPEYRLYAPFSFELQIRTVVQDSWSIIDHKIKYKKSIPNTLKRRINTLAALFELADREFLAIRDATRAELDQTAEIYPEIEQETEATSEEVESEKETQRVESGPRFARLDAFNFLPIAQHFFPKFPFEEHKVDGFTQEITSRRRGLTRGRFNFYLRSNLSTVRRYQAELKAGGDTMNPYTIIRHCLYAGNHAAFASLLTDAARARFDEWLNADSGSSANVVKFGAAAEQAL
ncbi:GTP pyrophosphokinase [Rhizobium leguminosarum]|uniref:GTP pyrophosphokinase n=1 Tax=Rhizobium leguminosarum TaxID=384 RepID=UPI001441F148|nr:(p)ppGpp synthetase [Rhizobium leguminosarum]NKL04503.1 (p)ppGpp synthetase [Rhizobium leguminosarum bv. viciae]NKL83964.1 (p)ppGpp synthetase [Rhizobium leguminosarum bv. viciae]NKL89667.1 (p)ppGpp synthetase [Rhizobium leguminosarum bv. viciae]NKM90634.1 (p)ppGpp synthetase [Rhizobium leguminosarum bv. viciae]